MNINIDTDLLDFVTAQATLDNVTPEVWVERKANGAIRRVMKDKVVDQINSAPITEVKRYLTAVDVVKAEIVAEKGALASEKLDAKIDLETGKEII